MKQTGQKDGAAAKENISKSKSLIEKKKVPKTQNKAMALYKSLSIDDRIFLKHFIYWHGRQRWHLHEIKNKNFPVQSNDDCINAIYFGWCQIQFSWK